MADTEVRSEVRSTNPKVELPYMYLMARYIMYYPSLMTTVSPSKGFTPFLQLMENSSWSQYYMFYIQKATLRSSNYQLDRCFPEISNA